MIVRSAPFLFHICLASALHGQAPGLAWQAFFDGSLPGEDEARALVITPDNTIYVTGSSTNIAPQGTITTLHYTSSGAQLWADHPYGPSQDSQNKGIDLALDPWGHVYVGGSFSANAGDLCVIKYNSGGRLWRKNFEQYPTADVPDEATGIAVDDAGEVYVSGFITSTSGMGLESYLLKVDSSGNELWHQAFSPSSADETAADVAVSPSGNIYVCGDWWNMDGNGGIDACGARFSSIGTIVWNEGFEGPAMNDKAMRVQATAADGALIAGRTSTGGSPDALVLARDAGGAELWHVVHAGTGNLDDEAVDVRELSDGRVVAVVHSRELVGGSLRHTITTLVVDAGTVVWSDQFVGGAGLGAWPTSLAVDAADNIFIAGYEAATGGGTTDGVVLKYTSSGSLQWSIPYDGGSNADDRFNAIALNAFGDVVVCGTSHTSTTDSRYVTVQFGNAVGLEEGSSSVVPMAFPNPANERITLHRNTGNATVEVFDALGQRMITTRAGTIDVSAWAEGLYIVSCDGRTQRFIVQH